MDAPASRPAGLPANASLLKEFCGREPAESMRHKRLVPCDSYRVGVQFALRYVKGEGRSGGIAFHQQYRRGRGPAIQLFDAQTGEPMGRATVNVDGHPALTSPPGEPPRVAIRNHDENEGMLEALQQAGIVGEPIRTVRVGWNDCPVVPLLVAA